MKIISAKLILACLLATSFASAAVTTITFDDLPTPDIRGTRLTDVYSGMIWENMFYVDGDINDFNPSGYQNGVVSSPNVAAMADDSIGGDGIPLFSQVTRAGGGFFDFNSAWLAGAWEDGLTVQVRGYRLGVLVYDTSVIVNANGPLFFTFNYIGIDALRFDTVHGVVNPNTGPGGRYFVIDDMTVTIPSIDTDGDGVPDAEDHCVASILGGKVDVGNGPTSIDNDGVDADGCSIQDLVNECAEAATDHGEYVSCIAELAEDLRAAGIITKQQSIEMKQSAGKSNVGK